MSQFQETYSIYYHNIFHEYTLFIISNESFYHMSITYKFKTLSKLIEFALRLFCFLGDNWVGADDGTWVERKDQREWIIGLNGIKGVDRLRAQCKGRCPNGEGSIGRLCSSTDGLIRGIWGCRQGDTGDPGESGWSRSNRRAEGDAGSGRGGRVLWVGSQSKSVSHPPMNSSASRIDENG